MSTPVASIPVPDLEDPAYAPYWSGLAEGRLTLPACSACDRIQWPPRPICRHCGARDRHWVEREPRATLYTWTVVEFATVRGFEVPYVPAVVTLDSDPDVRLVGQVVGMDPGDLSIGMALEGRFDAVNESSEPFTLLRWAPRGA